MAIVSTTGTKDKTKPGYPYLGVYGSENGPGLFQVILFIKKDTGMLVKGSTELKADDMYYTSWSEKLYKPYDGVVTLQNV